MAAPQAVHLLQYMKDLQDHHQILSEIAQTDFQIRWEASRQTDRHPVHHYEQDRGGKPCKIPDGPEKETTEATTLIYIICG